jgi:DNA repair exonuclease SbcCD nuclease subunit
MKLTILVIGDPHIQCSNIQEVNMFIERLLVLLESVKPDMIVILGDLLHNHEKLHTIPMNKAYELINKMRSIAETYILVGNHDIINNQQFLTSNHWMNGIKEWSNVFIIDKVLHKTIKEFNFTFVPYVPNGRFFEALNTIEKQCWEKSNCIFAHQEFKGCKMGHIFSIEGDEWPLDAPEIVSGHIHSRQIPQPNIYYPGSMLQHAFGESNSNVISFLTFDNTKKSYLLQETDLDLPRKRIIYMEVESFEDYVHKSTKDTIKITLSGGYEQFKALKKTKKYRNFIKESIKIIFKVKKIESDELIEKTTSETSFSNILKDIIYLNKNKYLIDTYNKIINYK